MFKNCCETAAAAYIDHTETFISSFRDFAFKTWKMLNSFKSA